MSETSVLAPEPTADAPTPANEGRLPETVQAPASAASTLLRGATVAPVAAAALSACGGGGGAPNNSIARPQMVSGLPGSGGVMPASAGNEPSLTDAARFLTQATFGPTSVEEIEALRAKGYEAWLWEQFNAPVVLHTSFLDMAVQTATMADPKMDKHTAGEEMSYEAIWQQWLDPSDPTSGQLRARVAFALSEIFVISNIAPDIKPYAMSSYMDMLNRNAFGNYRQLLEDVTLHPAMGYYLNMLRSQKANPTKGTHPNENYAREVLQLFSIGLAKLNVDGSTQTQLDANGKVVPIPTYTEDVVKGFAAAFTGWSFGGEGNADPKLFWGANFNDDKNWTHPMLAFASRHSTGTKLLLNNVTLPDGGTPEQDMQAALDNIANHPNVGPFICRQLIQRLVTSNPSADYIKRVANVFNNNGQGERGDLRAVIQAILLDTEARGDDKAAQTGYGKLREPVIRLTNFLRAVGAKSASGYVGVTATDSADDSLGQSPLLAPSVFNFFSPNFRPAGDVAAAGLVAPEFQITTEMTVVSSLNFFKALIGNKSYLGCCAPEDWRLTWNYEPLMALAADADALIDRLNLLFFTNQMSAATREIMKTLIQAIPDTQTERRVRNALILAMVAPDYVVQK